MKMKDKVILVDCDGVLLDWEYAFHQWMTKHGFEMREDGHLEYQIGKRYKTKQAGMLIRMFNESATIRKLPPLRDAIKYVRMLHEEHGFIFHAITSLSNDEYAQHLRTKNLRELFGTTIFDKFTYLDTGADKDEVLEAYRDTGCWWVEDKPANAIAGLNVGLKPILVDHHHNRDFTHSEVPVAMNWKEIYNLITGDFRYANTK